MRVSVCFDEHFAISWSFASGGGSWLRDTMTFRGIQQWLGSLPLRGGDCEMKFEEKIEFPISLKEMWDFSMDFNEWPLWYSGMLEIVEPEKGAWSKPGDSVRIAYKMLGRRIEYTCTVS